MSTFMYVCPVSNNYIVSEYLTFTVTLLVHRQQIRRKFTRKSTQQSAKSTIRRCKKQIN